ncbi:hypothetical protein FSP39_023748 [Pinctada imbricata]|uniref:C2H2-type domain-containing protein n=1 Tax=Pinctada imbricata TaxID=66713 RepID=A0AA89C4G7_PINIB|nr:hypothetical protein FSP39_023748 [Pinctada imbricata]
MRMYGEESNDLHRCRWMNCERRFMYMEDLVNHVNDQHVKLERPDVDYQCKWDDCPRRGKGFNARNPKGEHVMRNHKCKLIVRNPIDKLIVRNHKGKLLVMKFKDHLMMRNPKGNLMVKNP